MAMKPRPVCPICSSLIQVPPFHCVHHYSNPVPRIFVYDRDIVFVISARGKQESQYEKRHWIRGVKSAILADEIS